MLETLAEYRVHEILPLIPGRKILFKINEEEFRVKTSSVRLRLFKDNLQCVTCGLVGSIFRLQKQSGRNEKPHLNLYALKGSEWILMTKDHVRPKSKGGRDHTDNLQVMCAECNEAKGSRYDA